jgi:ligand-binding sensor domain-containing protein/signal transduction histidine kinase
LRNFSSFRDSRTSRAALCVSLGVASAMLWLAHSAKALDPSKEISQYTLDQWGPAEGYPGGSVYAFAQTPDGYLWIATEKGLVRFDGITFRLLTNPSSPTFPKGPVLGLAVDGEGALWIRSAGSSLLRYRDGAFQDLSKSLPEPEKDITAMSGGSNGDILLSGQINGLLRYSKGHFVKIAPSSQRPGLVISLAETRDGKVWTGMRGQGLYYLENERFVSVSNGLPDNKVNSLFTPDGRDLWIASDTGVVRWTGQQLVRAVGTSRSDRFQALAMASDRDANIWIGSSKGLLRIGSRNDSFVEQRDTRSADTVGALFEDREGNLWVGTTHGVERLRDRLFTTYRGPAGLPSESTGPVYVDPQGRTWFAPVDGGLYWLKGGRLEHVRDAGLDKDVVYSIDGRQGNVWLGRRDGGLTHLVLNGNLFTTRTYTDREGLAQNSVFAVHSARDGSVWAGTLSAGLSRFKNGTFTTFTTANGLVSSTITAMSEAPDGTMWFGTPNGLNKWSQGQWRSYTSRDGLPPGRINRLLQDPTGVLLIGTANGLAFLRSGKIEMLSGPAELVGDPILGIEEDRTGALWIATGNRILRADRDKLLHNALGPSDLREYGLADGLRSTQGVNRVRSVIADSLGQIWISTGGGISVVRPRPLSYESAPALVHVEAVLADGRSLRLHPSGENLRIPAPHQRIIFSYAGLSLSIPERVRFRYRLDDFDHDWSEPTTAREAAYTNLDAGSYRFRVMASNSEGLWNGAEYTLQVEIEPVFWKRWWFRALGFSLLMLLILSLIRMRMMRLTRQLNMRFEERLAERTRIAQALHDTLLQGLVSASMQLYVANEHLPPGSPAKPLVGRVLELMGRVTEEGRNALQGLRTSPRAHSDLGQALSQIRQEFPLQSKTGFRVIVDGTPRPLHPGIREDVYFICHEALSNAFRHSHASEVEVELEYAPAHLRVLVRDNGSGIDPQVLESGRDGHWGLSGMKERTRRIGGKLRVLSRAVAGTEIELSVPGPLAFRANLEGQSKSWLAKLPFRKRGTRGPNT